MDSPKIVSDIIHRFLKKSIQDFDAVLFFGKSAALLTRKEPEKHFFS